MILDTVFFLVGGLIDLLADIMPPFPEQISSFVSQLGPRLTALTQSLPYGNLMPWGSIAVASLLIPQVYLASMSIRVLRRVFGWVRSRGNSDS